MDSSVCVCVCVCVSLLQTGWTVNTRLHHCVLRAPSQASRLYLGEVAAAGWEAR